jgi:hypothetical protein
MPPPPEGYSWKSLESAPPDEDVTLQVTDGRGKPYVLVNACRLTAAGWVSSSKGTPLAVTPVLGGDTFPHAAAGFDDIPARQTVIIERSLGAWPAVRA